MYVAPSYTLWANIGGISRLDNIEIISVLQACVFRSTPHCRSIHVMSGLRPSCNGRGLMKVPTAVKKIEVTINYQLDW